MRTTGVVYSSRGKARTCLRFRLTLNSGGIAVPPRRKRDDHCAPVRNARTDVGEVDRLRYSAITTPWGQGEFALEANLATV